MTVHKNRKCHVQKPQCAAAMQSDSCTDVSATGQPRGLDKISYTALFL